MRPRRDRSFRPGGFDRRIDGTVAYGPLGKRNVAFGRSGFRARNLRRARRSQRLHGRRIDVAEKKNLDFLMGVSLVLSAELGSCAMRVSEVLALGTGSIVALDRAASDPVDLF